MSLAPDQQTLLPQPVAQWVDRAADHLSGLFGRGAEALVAPKVADNTGYLDARLAPRAPMNNDNLDVYVLAELGKMGMKRGKEITAQSHPELYQAWQIMSQRAGLKHVPQLILVESEVLNAASLHKQDAVAITSALMKKLDLREVCAVMGHELGHESSDHSTPRIAASALLVGGGMLAGDVVADKGGIRATLKPEALPKGRLRDMIAKIAKPTTRKLLLMEKASYILLGGLAGSVAARQVSVHPTEMDADRKGAILSGDPQGLILALEKLEMAHRDGELVHALKFLKSGYPSTKHRIAALEQIAAHSALPESAAALVERVAMVASQAVVQAPQHPKPPGVRVSGVEVAARVDTPKPMPEVVR